MLISGKTSLEFNRKQFLSLTYEDGSLDMYEIRYAYHCSPFKHAEVQNTILLVGHEEHCYFFDIGTNTQLTVLQLSGYFGHMYVDNELIYVADAHGLYCLNQVGTLLWSNGALGIDGVIIHDFGDAEIFGSGEWDPPGGWEDFVIDKKTGMSLDKRNEKPM